MTPLVIFLIIVGAGILILSCFLVDKSGNSGDVYATLANARELSLTEMEGIKDKVETLISEVSEQITAKTEDKLSQLSNEKIIAVNDFSNQVMEKINQNHEEVVFLYNMLNEKETELKETVKNIDKAKMNLAEMNKTEPEAVKAKNNSKSVSRKAVKEEIENLNVNTDTETLNNHNQKILEMYSQGFSVIDISRTLELGQGEVKLVIDLYKDK
ncbi:DUF6115 domain-containing protein [Anaerocolumna sp. MB42-C2]|uniref:DUF6115 domain-containing protein n=1 Tax=Anaerocolumna sp. MB42-C2 TaxID=3070997 RepID=UPI0027DF22A1|nr:DUF6115 domain-containing protein [Anaerocolumna sp. MB42-C2]WMJ88417.1 DUF6115 domain-containing protein [Anaerocolumna sp. MB42-C2]